MSNSSPRSGAGAVTRTTTVGCGSTSRSSAWSGASPDSGSAGSSRRLDCAGKVTPALRPLSDPPAEPPIHPSASPSERGRTVHGEPANAGHRVLAPDDAEFEAYLEQALHAAPPTRDDEAPEGPDTVIVLDFGSQYAQLIARRVRELNVYSELLPHDTPWAEIERRKPKAIILSGGPASVYDEGAPRADGALWTGRVPVLGICYGLQLMAHELGGEVLPAAHREYGPADVTITEADGLFLGLDREQPVWMSHGDAILRPPEGC